MAEPLTLGLIGGLVLAEGVKFLYEQANQVLEGRRASRAAEAGSQDAEQPGHGLLRRPLDPGRPARELPAATLAVLGDLARFLDPYVRGQLPVEPSDRELVAVADAVRRVLEYAYDRDLSFVEEPRSGVLIHGRVDIDEVAGYAAAVRLRVADSRAVSGHARVRSVAPGGEVVGVDVERPPAS
ncbi:hypothetical protein [Micromonospora tarensis]|uniref:Uncharacterized protein n=1 Tax=Micromonospora tarensis TaxID=2806100 RepID=A0ABS1YPD9_9ACTN|nr:hypothetical protein [Micromonospora tarensis]MBM0278971.1 hypothetical protein [Micromonospora tarensis]